MHVYRILYVGMQLKKSICLCIVILSCLFYLTVPYASHLIYIYIYGFYINISKELLPSINK